MENKKENYQEFNNQVLLDLILKSTKLTTFLTNLLDINNVEKLEKEIIISKDYNEIQEHIIKAIQAVSSIFAKEMQELQLKEREISNEQKETN